MLGLINRIRRYRWALLGRKKIKALVQHKHKKGEAIKIILGSSDQNDFNGEWINTDIPQFDITNAAHWAYIFGDIKIDNLLAEHVMEHLTADQNLITITIAKDYMQKNGNFRIAVPDKNNRDEKYQNGVKPGGSDKGSHDHKIFFSMDDYNQLFKHSGLKIVPLEYYDSAGNFHASEFNDMQGYISRSHKHKFHYPPIPKYSSLIFDLKK